MPTVLLTGATGFIGLELTKQLLEKGYRVVGNVRALEKGERASKFLKSENFSYYVVNDISQPNAFHDFVKDHPEATAFFHVASPVKFSGDAETEIIQPAVNGTVIALQAAKQYGVKIRHFVITSSIAAMTSFAIAANPNVTLTEDTWCDYSREEAFKNPVTGYCASKAFAEKAAWDFMRSEKPNFLLTTICPTYVFGPQAFDELVTDKLNTSSQLLNSFLKLNSPDDEWKKIKVTAVDIRDVAAAHIVAVEKEQAKNQRLLLVSGPYCDQTILNVLHKEFPQESKNMPVGDPDSEKNEKWIQAKVNCDRTKEILGFPLISVEQSIADTYRQIFKQRE